ncbi:glycosaminoglycan attachment protein [Clostridium fungisolvens]|uniref:Glycosaminoglycan attachment protein n=1 Tax=Clostridium fungisolvens TaxID=1604897 RepID=A0A6V8SKZ4_9CLOT|nr:glycosaminoglycan attachment protein [Clostridium fungisolvens]GFP77436.1 hypothetical protein bsdtw1_03564 [Clostridium fungisolvens]
MRYISRKAFDVYVGFIRDSAIFAIADEVKWYTNEDTTLFAVILFDFTDKDYNAVFLARNQNKKIKYIDNEISFKSIREAEEWINFTENKVNIGKIQLKPDIDDRLGVDLFHLVVEESRLHPYFKAINEIPAHSAAKKLISEITPYFIDVDGNFVEQFQTSGFNSRLWELYLFCYFHEEGLKIDREHEAPDFMLSNGDISVAVEAVIAENRTPYLKIDERRIPIDVNVEEETKNKLPLIYGSPLYSKLNHTTKDRSLHYWQYDHTRDIPFVIAIADFHDVLAMNMSTTALINYLYGLKHSHYYDENGNLVVVGEKIKSHIKESTGVKIPSGFFFQPGAENVSAIIHSASGTISKFDRMGKQSGFDTNNTIMIRVSTVYNSEPNADKPLVFENLVDENCEETWGEGISVYHNPNAVIPLPRDFFPSAAQHFLKDGKIVTVNSDAHVYSSYNLLISNMP